MLPPSTLSAFGAGAGGAAIVATMISVGASGGASSGTSSGTSSAAASAGSTTGGGRLSTSAAAASAAACLAERFLPPASSGAGSSSGAAAGGYVAPVAWALALASASLARLVEMCARSRSRRPSAALISSSNARTRPWSLVDLAAVRRERAVAISAVRVCSSIHSNELIVNSFNHLPEQRHLHTPISTYRRNLIDQTVTKPSTCVNRLDARPETALKRDTWRSRRHRIRGRDRALEIG